MQRGNVTVVNIHEAKTHFSRLLTRVGQGEEIVIAKAGTPIARLVPIEAKAKKRIPGSAQNKINISRTFDKPLPRSILKTFLK